MRNQGGTNAERYEGHEEREEGEEGSQYSQENVRSESEEKGENAESGGNGMQDESCERNASVSYDLRTAKHFRAYRMSSHELPLQLPYRSRSRYLQ